MNKFQYIFTIIITVILYCVTAYIALVNDEQLAEGRHIAIITLLSALFGTYYVIKKGDIPEFIYKIFNHSPHGGRLTKEDDPNNLPPIISISFLIIVGIILIMGVLFL